MKKCILIIILLNINLLFTQEKDPIISVSFQEEPILNVFQKIEKESSFKFFYLDQWFNDQPVSGVYSNKPISDILEDLFKDSLINYYITNDNRIILTQNSLIYDNLPEGFFNEETVIIDEEDEYEEDNVNPVFSSSDKANSTISVETVRIGKENRYNNRKRFHLSGIIKNSVSGKPVDNVAIVLKGKNIGVATNSRGYYEIALKPGLNILVIKLIGFKNIQKNVIIYNDGYLNIALDEDYDELDTVILKANYDKNVNDANTGVTELNVRKIKNIPLVLGERDILKVATALPGITTAGEGSSGFNVRGGSADQNLILLDDGVIYNPAHFFGIFSAINPFSTGSVKIYKGNIPAEFGGRLSSVFDITTKEANTEKFSGEVSIGPVTGNAVLEIPLKKEKSAILIGGRATYSNWILRSLDEESLKKSQASFFDGIAKYNTKIGKNDALKATAYFSRDAYSITTDSLFSYSNRVASLRWNHNFNDNNRGSIIIANSQYKFNIDFDGDTNNDFKLNYDIIETELKFKMATIVNKSHKLNYGLSGKLYSVNPGTIDPFGGESIIESLTIPKEKGLEVAVFASDDFTVNDKLLLSAGIRFSTFAALGESIQGVYQEGLPISESTLIENKEFGKNEVIETYGGPEVRVSARYFILPDFSVKASFNNTFQYIHTLSNNTTLSPTDTYKLSDLNVKPQEANQYSLGFFKNFNEADYELSVEGYYKKSKNILDFKVGAELLLNEDIETQVLQGNGKSYGVEFLFKKNEGKLNGWIGYTYSKSLIQFASDFNEERVNNGEFFPSNFDKPHDVSVVANYKLTKRFSFSANFVYQTGRPITVPVGVFEFDGSEFVLYSDRNKFRIPDYYRLDLSFNVEGNHKIKKFAHSFWNISVYNVLGRDNPYSLFFVTEGGKVKAFQSSIFSIPVPTITYNFKF